MKQGKLNILVFAFIAILIGVILLDVLGDMISASKTTKSVLNETLTIASSTATVANTDHLGLFQVTYFGNGTDNSIVTPLRVTIDVDVNWTEAGVITVDPLNITDGPYNISYGWYPNEYVQNGTARTLMGLILIFFAIAIVFVGIKYFKDMSADWK